MDVVLIIGGGLGGLALAHLLLQGSTSIQVLVFERDANECARDQGYCIGIDRMGLDVLKNIRVLDDLLSNGSGGHCSLSFFRLVNGHLKRSLNLNAKDTVLIYREDLRRALLKNIDIQWNKRFVSYTVHDDRVEAHFEDGTSVQGSILIGCDGAKSLVREQLLPAFRRDDLGIMTIAGTVDDKHQFGELEQLTKDSLVRIFGKQGHSLLVLPFRQSFIWALSWPEPKDKPTEFSPSQCIEKARQHFNHTDLVRLIEQCPPSSHLGPYRLYSAIPLKQNPFPNNARVTLLGDAAHPMTTHAGKGANTAFADASDLAQVLLNRSTSSLGQYERQMFKRGFAAVRQSLGSTKMIHSTGWRAVLRDGILSIVYYVMASIDVLSAPFRWYGKKHH